MNNKTNTSVTNLLTASCNFNTEPYNGGHNLFTVHAISMHVLFFLIFNRRSTSNYFYSDSQQKCFSAAQERYCNLPF